MNRKTKSFLPLKALLLAAILLLPGCKPDDVPTAYTFAGQTNVAPDTLVESEVVTISGITIPARMSITGGEYSIDGHAYRDKPGVISNNQKVRVRVRSSSESSGEVSATVTIGRVEGTFKVKTVNFSGRVEAEAADPIGGATIVADTAASKGKAVFAASAGQGISITESLEAKTLILSYRSDTAGTLEANVNGAPAGKFTLHPTAGAYATSALIATIKAGDAIVIAAPANSSLSNTNLDYVAFAETPFRSVSTIAATEPWASDGLSVGPTGDVFISGGTGREQVLRITPTGEITVIASGLASGNDSGFDSSGNLYVVSYRGSSVHKITPEGVMTTFASGLDGPAGLWVDQNDNVLVSLYGAGFSGTGAAVLSIAPDGIVSTYASGGPLMDVVGLVGDENGNVYASNYSSGAIYNITGGNISLLAETGTGANQLCYTHGYIYVPAIGDDQIRRVKLDGTVEHFAGTSTRQTIDGPIASAGFLRPSACDFAEDGTVMYLLDWESGLIRRIDSGSP